MAQLSIDPKQSEIFNRLSQLGTEAFNRITHLHLIVNYILFYLLIYIHI